VRFLIELEGPLVDVAAAYQQAHRDVAAGLGWSTLDAGTFWRRLRKEGPTANFLPGAKPLKLARYSQEFAAQIETDETVDRFAARPGLAEELPRLERFGPCRWITVGANLSARQRIMEGAGLADRFAGQAGLNADPRRRAGELIALAADDPRTLVVAGSDAVVRAARSAELVVVGIDNGPCPASRLFAAGAALVYGSLGELADSLASGAADLIKAGLLPLPPGP
jgi:phosphoglycolate phosphatase-like HAD superfamily hydrolase